MRGFTRSLLALLLVFLLSASLMQQQVAASEIGGETETVQETDIEAAEDTEDTSDSEDSTEDWSFNLSQYRTQLLLDDYHQRGVLDEYMNAYESPAETLLEGLVDNTTFQASLLEWRKTNFLNSDGSSENLVKEAKLYYTILMNIICDGEESTYKGAELASTAKKVCITSNKKWLQFVKDSGFAIVKSSEEEESSEEDTSKLEAFIENSKDLVLDKLTDKAIEYLKTFDSRFKIIDIIDKTSATVADYMNAVALYESLSEDSDGIFKMLDALEARCGNSVSDEALHLAIEKVKTSLSGIGDALVVTAIDHMSDKLSGNAIKTYISEPIKTAKKSWGLSDADAISFGISASNFLFNTDTTKEAYENLVVFNNIMDKIRLGMIDSIQAYEEEKTDETEASVATCSQFLNLFHLFFSGNSRGCEYAKAYADVLNKAAITNLVFDKDSNSFTRFSDLCDSLQKEYEQEYQFLSSDVWRVYLKSDYPELYEQFSGTEDEDWVNCALTAVTGVKFAMTDVTWNKSFKTLKMVAQVEPASASNRKVTYSSSDTSVLEITSTGRVIPKKNGTVKVTCTTLDGGFTASTYITLTDGDIIFTYDNNTYTIPVTDGEKTDDYGYMDTTLTKGNLNYATEVEIPEKFSAGGFKCKITAIGNNAFYSNYAKDILIPDTVTSIGDYAFKGCRISTLILPENLTSIGDYAFYNSSLSSISIPESVTSIGIGAFEECLSLSGNLVIPDSVVSLGSSAFKRCYKLTSIHFGKGLTEIPDGVCRMKVKESNPDSALSSVTFGSDITKIGEDAFYYCNALTSVDWAHLTKMTDLGGYSFAYCTALTTVDWNSLSNMTSIGESAFFHCESLAQPDWTKMSNVTTMGYRCFAYCPNIKNAVIPAQVTSLEGTFLHCENLTSVTLPQKLTSIGMSTFSHCALNSITIPATVTFIDDNAFDAGLSSSVTSVTIPAGVTNIGERAFAENPSLTSITMPEKLNRMETSVFLNCSSLRSITLPAYLTSIPDYTFCGCIALSSVTIKGTIKRIGEEAFAYCSALKTLPKMPALTSIGIMAFMDSGLTTFDAPACLTTLGGNAFFDCKSLKDVYLHCARTKNINNLLFSSVGKNFTTLHYPAGETAYTSFTNCILKDDANQTQLSGCSVTLAKTGCTYTGKAIQVGCTVKNGSSLLKSGTDYKVTYTNNTNVGVATITITGLNNYAGTIKRTFKITPKNTAISKLTAASKGFTVTWKKQAAQTTGYQLQYSTGSKFTSAKTLTVSKNTTVSKKISKLSAKKKYYVRIRTYKKVGKTVYYSGWSATKTVKTK